MTVSKTPVNKHDIVSNMPLSMEVYRVSLASDTYYKHNIQRVAEFLEIFPTHDRTRPTENHKISTRPNPTKPVGRPNP